MTLKDFHKSIGLNIKRLRVKRNLTQSELGQLVNNPKQNIYGWESGKPMSMTTLYQISKALKVDPRELLP